jgi:protein transport protein SEC61 subunit beta
MIVILTTGLLFLCHDFSFDQATQRRAAARAAAGAGTGAAGRPRGAGTNILQFYTDDSPGLQVGPTTVLVASLSFVGIVVLLHILGKFRS